MSWYLAVLKKYAVFAGRARRKEYWYFLLFSLIITIVLAVIDAITGTLSEDIGIGLLSGIYTLIVFIPSMAVSVRRLHDTNRTGWWLLINLIPVIGGIVFFILSVLDGTPGENQYGSDPKSDHDPRSAATITA